MKVNMHILTREFEVNLFPYDPHYMSFCHGCKGFPMEPDPGQKVC